MKKKYSFDDRLGHTSLVISGEKTVIIIPAPPMPLDGGSFVLIGGDIVFADSVGAFLRRGKLPLALGASYKIMRPYRELSGDRYGRGDYAWRDKRAVPISSLKDSFRVVSLSYKRVSQVSTSEWVSNGLSVCSDGTFSFNGTFYPSASEAGAAVLERMFGFIPEYVYVYNIKVDKGHE